MHRYSACVVQVFARANRYSECARVFARANRYSECARGVARAPEQQSQTICDGLGTSSHTADAVHASADNAIVSADTVLASADAALVSADTVIASADSVLVSADAVIVIDTAHHYLLVS